MTGKINYPPHKKTSDGVRGQVREEPQRRGGRGREGEGHRGGRGRQFGRHVRGEVGPSFLDMGGQGKEEGGGGPEGGVRGNQGISFEVAKPGGISKNSPFPPIPHEACEG